MKNIAIVGAGIAGLTAAYYLKKFGYTVTVYEASDRVGGRMTTDTINDCLIDRGAQFLSSEYSTLLPLIQELGLDTELVETNAWMGIVRDKKIRKMSGTHFLSPVLSGYLSLKDAFQFFIKMKKLKSAILPLPLDDYAAWSALDDEYVDTFFRREFSNNILDYIIEPLIQGFYYQLPEETSKVIALMLLGFMLRKGKELCLRHGMGSLPEKMASVLDIKFNCPITSLMVETNGNVALTSSQNTFYADRVILSVPAPLGKSIFKTANDIEAKLLASQYSSTINIAIATHATWQLPQQLSDIYGILIPRSERKRIVSIGVESKKSKQRINEGELFDIMLDGTQAAALFNFSDEEIIKIISPELEFYFPGLTQAIRFAHIIRWKYAAPICYLNKSNTIKKYQETLNPSARIILAGDTLGFPNSNSAAFTGKWAAEFIKQADGEYKKK